MDIVSRIKSFLDKYQIANSQFADKCDIPRPTLSQLLNGRNKKVSDEVISKIHAAYPNLSIMWLMFGEEPMLLSPMETEEKASPAKELHFHDVDDDELFQINNSVAENPPIEKKEDSNRIVFDTSLQDDEDKTERTVGIPQALESFVRGTKIKEEVPNANVVGKHIVNVMVFYSDNSFESFVPSR